MKSNQTFSVYINLDPFGCIQNVDVTKRLNESVTDKVAGDVNIKCKECCSNISLEIYTSYTEENCLIIKEEVNETEFEAVLIDVKKSDNLYSEEEETKPEVLTEISKCEDTEPVLKPPSCFKCSTCDLILASKESLINHAYKCPPGKLLKCPSCGLIFQTVKQLRCHMKTCNVEFKTCQKCKMKFTEKAFNAHKKKKSCSAKQPVQCENCKKTLVSNGHLQRHQLSCRPGRVGLQSCDICDKTFSTYYLLKQHIRVVHLKNIEKYICQVCGKELKSKGGLEKHIEYIHDVLDAAKVYECDHCQHTFKNKHQLEYHIILQHVKDYNFLYCNECDPPKKFLSQKRLNTHKICHVKTEFPCPECSQIFKTEKYLQTHLYRIHTPHEQKIKYSCDFPQCNFVTTSKKQNKWHKYVHLDDSQKPFKCDHCEKAYTSKTALKHHNQMHTGLRPFSCEVCLKTFKAKDALKVHFRLHTGEKPYQCEICSQRFADRGCYRNHIMAHEKQLNLTLSKSVKKFPKTNAF